MAEFRVLMIDDDPGTLRFLRRGFQLEGFTVIDSDSGAAALELIRTSYPDVIILDWMMPGVDGPKTIGRIRASGARVPVIFLTGRDGLRADGLKLGADEYLEKPVSFSLLLARVYELLGSSEGGG